VWGVVSPQTRALAVLNMGMVASRGTGHSGWEGPSPKAALPRCGLP